VPDFLIQLLARDACLHHGVEITGYWGETVSSAAQARALIEETGARLRAMMPWIGANKLVDKEKN
jgi:hypothetical protein